MGQERSVLRGCLGTGLPFGRELGKQCTWVSYCLAPPGSPFGQWIGYLFPAQALDILLSLQGDRRAWSSYTRLRAFYKDFEHSVPLQDSSGSIWFSSLEKHTHFGTAGLSKVSSQGTNKMEMSVNSICLMSGLFYLVMK